MATRDETCTTAIQPSGANPRGDSGSHTTHGGVVRDLAQDHLTNSEVIEVRPHHACVACTGDRGWSTYGAERSHQWQPVANGEVPRSGSNKPKKLRWVGTSCRSALMVRRGSTVRVRQRWGAGRAGGRQSATWAFGGRRARRNDPKPSAPTLVDARASDLAAKHASEERQRLRSVHPKRSIRIQGARFQGADALSGPLSQPSLP